jgi:mono/diheme cytochrome c family protein
LKLFDKRLSVVLLNRKSLLVTLVLSVVGLLLAACGGGEATPECLKPDGGTLAAAPCEVAGDGTDGVTIDTPTATAPDVAAHPGIAVMRNAGCSGCHTIDGLAGFGGVLGPNLSTVGAKGADYIRQSIIEPTAVIVDGYENLMPGTFADLLSADEIDDIVDFLSTR